LDDDHLLLRAEANMLIPLCMVGRNKEAAKVAEDVIRRAEAQGDLQSLGQALNNAAETAMIAGQFEQSRALRERVVSVMERLGDKFQTAFAFFNMGEIHIFSGDWSAAREYVERYSAINERAEKGWRAAYERGHLGWLALLQGDLEEGLRLLNEGIRLAGRFNDLQAIRGYQRLLAEQDILAGHPQSAINRLQPLLDRPGLKEHSVTNLMPTLAWAYLEAGDTTSAEQTASEAIERMVEQENQRHLPHALRVKGMVLSRQERWDEAEQAFSEAVSVARPMPYPYAEARSLYEWGKMGEQSRQKLEEALAIFQRLGAKKDMERTEQALEGIAGTQT
jgi:tetratricopeptide (TPR) repeat protein